MKNSKKAALRNASVQERQRAAERLARGSAANKATAEKKFPYETWIRSDSVKMKKCRMTRKGL